jgi:glycosyltransferase involved in cell wall biosynthesis
MSGQVTGRVFSWALDLSVVIPAHNVADTLGEQLDALLGQEWDGEWEILVVDNRSTDGTAALVERYASNHSRIRLVHATERAGPSYSRATGIEHAASDAIALCDADDVVGPRWVRAMGDALREHRVVTGPVETETLNPAWLVDVRGRLDITRCRTWYDLFPVVAGGNLGIRREVFATVGGFDDRFSTSEDHEFSLRLWQHNESITFEPDALLHYRYRASPRALWEQGNAYGASRPLLRRNVAEAGIVPPPRFAGWRSWVWLVSHSPGLRSPTGRARWLWVAGNRVGHLRGSIRDRTLFL